MKNIHKQNILIVDDIAENIKILINLLTNDYGVFFAKNGKTALEIAQKNIPDLILLDIEMPGINGYEVCKRLKEEPETKDIPVIFISAMNTTGDETKGFEIGAVDYITKPFNPPIVKARVKNHLKLRESMLELKRLYGVALDANPRTGLPGNNSIEKRIQKALDEKERVCVIYSDLDNFKAFNDKYGFARGDEVIMFTARVMEESILRAGLKEVFVGHIGGDDFVLVVPMEKAKLVADLIAERFDEGIIQFYNTEDIATKSIQSIDRQGKKKTFPIMSISMAGVDLSKGLYTKYLQVNDMCVASKKMAKSMPGSTFFIDRRTI